MAAPVVPDLWLLALIVAGAHAVQVIVGFGASMLSLTLASLFAPIELLLPLLVPLNLGTPIYLAARYRDDVDRHAWWQRGHARLEAKPGQKVRAYVPESEGHDDLLYSELLMVDAAYNVGSPQVITSGQVDFYIHGQQQPGFDLFAA